MADASITKQALADALKTLLQERPFSKISVGDICENCGMNRKSFYYHFRDKYDLLNWIFTTECAQRLRRCPQANGWSRLYLLCEYLYQNRDFYRRAFTVQGQNSFSDYFREFMFGLLSAELKPRLGQMADFEFIINFYVDAFDCATRRWLQQSDPVLPDRFCGLLQESIAAVGPVVRQASAPLGPPPSPDGTSPHH